MEVLKEYTPISVKNSSIKFTFTSILAYDLLEYNQTIDVCHIIKQ